MINASLLKKEERAVFTLRSLYNSYGYQPFKMSKFEEYDFYVRNKDFLISDRVITFNDTNGKLLALKPDVTLSIIKNTADEEGCKQKVYYNENVYRISGGTGQFKEIMQTGLECIGDIDLTDKYEAVFLAAKSLSLVSDDFVLDISHMGILSAILDSASGSESFKREVTALIADKNTHETAALCSKYGIAEDACDAIVSLAGMYGDRYTVLAKLLPICKDKRAIDAYNELKSISDLLSATEFSHKIKFDFSVVNNMNYYNGIVFRGFLSGICEGVLAGGEYGKLLARLGRHSCAIGFALYLDLLAELDKEMPEYDVDVLLLYSETTSPLELAAEKEKTILAGKTVFASRCIPEKLRYREIINMEEKG